MRRSRPLLPPRGWTHRLFGAPAAILTLVLLAGPLSAEPRDGPDRFARVDSIIEAAIRDGATPGAALAFGRRGGPMRVRTYGRIDWDPESAEVTDSTLYDLASLTKVMGTTTAAMMLVQQKRLSLDAPIRRYLPGWPKHGAKSRITVKELLLHTSGLPEGADLWWVDGTRAQRLKWIASRPLRSKPGTHTLYSDLGMIVLGEVIEKITHTRLDGFLDARVFQPLGMRDTKFNPLNPRNGSPFDLARIAPTEVDREIRGKHLQGEVQDLTAAALGGVAGHAGLFSSIRDVAKFAQVILTGASGKDTKILRSTTVRRFLAVKPGASRTLGWDVAGDDRPFSAVAVGHTGYTGTSIWIDPRKGYYVVLLTNRVDPTAANKKHLALRRAVNEAVSELMDERLAD